MWFSEDTPPVDENQFVVVIALRKPFEIASSVLKRRHNGDEIVTGKETLPRRPENQSSSEDVLMPDQRTGQDNVKELAATNEKQKKGDIENDVITPTTSEVPPELSTQRQTLIEMLKRETEIVVSTLIDRGNERIELEEGDILELDAAENLHPKAGVVGGMVIVYDWL